jgi:hypothetical protein
LATLEIVARLLVLISRQRLAVTRSLARKPTAALGRLCVRFALAASSALKARHGVVMRTKFDPREDWKSKLKFRLR